MSEAAGEREWMGQALALAALADGTTSPNPRVGCVLVRDGGIVGRGLHRAPGSPHAEALAVAEAGEFARGATLYVNLEPCAHHGRTPPCADLLLAAGVRRVVASLQDPDPRVDGRGFDRLRQAGVEVEVGLLQSEAEYCNGPFLSWHRTGRPLVTLKAAMTLDGMLAAAEGRSRWITGEPARRFAHRLRLSHDAILVGAGTVRSDDPRLTVRLPGQERFRQRVVLSRSLNLDPSAHLFEAVDGVPPTRIYAPEEAIDSSGRGFGGAELIAAPASSDGLDLEWMLRDLGQQGVQSVLVEGGAQVFAAFLDAGLAERAAIFVSGGLIGARGGTPLIDRPTAERPDLGWRLSRERTIALGDDLALMGRVCAP